MFVDSVYAGYNCSTGLATCTNFGSYFDGSSVRMGCTLRKERFHRCFNSERFSISCISTVQCSQILQVKTIMTKIASGLERLRCADNHHSADNCSTNLAIRSGLHVLPFGGDFGMKEHACGEISYIRHGKYVLYYGLLLSAMFFIHRC